jgi:HAMP domain-containing protein
MVTDGIPPRPSRSNKEDEVPQKKSYNPLLLVAVAVIISAVFTWYWTGSLITPLANKADVTTSIEAMDKQIASLQSGLSSVQSLGTSVNSLNAQIAQILSRIESVQLSLSGYAKSDQISRIDSTANSANAKADATSAKIDALTAKVNAPDPLAQKLVDDEARISSLFAQQVTDNATIASLITRIQALETLPINTSGGGVSAIPNVNMSVTVVDEGSLQTDSSTLGEIKLTMVNSGTRDITDIVVRMYVYFDNNGSANQTVSATYGTWTPRIRQIPEIEIRGRLARLNAGETKRVYIDIKSWASIVGDVTILDTSASDLEVVDWNY